MEPWETYDTFLISYTINPQRKTQKKELEEVNFSSFWHMIQQFLSQKFLLITEKGIYFWHSVNLMISMFGIFLLSQYLKGYSYSRHEALP